MAVVYVVDDEPVNRTLIKGFLDASGYELIEFERGDDALAQCDVRPPDLVLLDVMMPGIDGFETVERLKQRAGVFLPVIMMTALSDIASRRHALLAGADDLLTKPIDREELALRVGKQLALRHNAATQLERNVELQEMQRFRTEMSQTIVHDLKNPAGAVLSTLEYALEESNRLPSEVVEALQDAHRSSRRLGDLLVDLLDMTRMEEAQMKLVREPVAAVELLRDLVQPRQREVRRRQVELAWSVEEGLQPLHVDRGLVVRILENLLDNALRYTPAHGRIVVSVARSGPGTRIEVGNSGAAVPKAARSIVFEKFSRLQAEPGRSNLGLGLYFCRLAVEAHGGRIWIEERPELATVFCIELPESVDG